MLFIAVTLLSACGTPGGEKTPPQAIESSDQKLQLDTDRELPPSEFASDFIRAEQSLFEFDWMSAQSILKSVSERETLATDDQYIRYLEARIHYVRGDQKAAINQLQLLRQTTANLALQHKILSFQRYMISLSGDHLKSAEMGVQLLGQTKSGAEQNTLHRTIWRDLQRASGSQIRGASSRATDAQWRGWLELAYLTAEATNDSQLKQSVMQWRSDNPDHPAAQTLPAGMDYLLSQQAEPKKVAILLPLSGQLAPAAQAVRDGYLANYYAARAEGIVNYELDIIDALAFNSVTEAYNTALATGADFIVGPLRKDAVEELAKLPGKQVPVLALNRIDRALPTGTTALVQLALAPEDEASQIAGLAFGQGARHALVIRPAGAWGNKMELALKRRWQQLGGEISTTASYSSREDHSASMSAALNIPSSERRARDIRSMLATKIEFTARRRQDLDVVFLLSKSGVEARSLKPLLDYHYASDLPVYATSNIYRGVADARDRDLNEIHLVETPWLLGANSETRTALAGGRIDKNAYTRLNALGADAFLLQTRFPQLQAGEDMLMRGNTGLLSLNPQLHITRELLPATFDGGILVAQ